MNGVRTIFRRKGYLLTALTAAVLLAASSGTALAQVTITGPAMNTVNEGEIATYTVNVKGFIPVGGSEGNLSVMLPVPSPTDTDDGTDGELTDVNLNLGDQYSVAVPANPNVVGAVAVAFNRSGSIRIQTNQDADAEDEKFTLSFTLTTAAGIVTTATGNTEVTLPVTAYPGVFTIDDDETQTYDLTLDAGQTPKEGAAINVTLTAKPAHADTGDNAGVELFVYLDVQPTIASITPASGAPIEFNATTSTSAVVVTPVGNDKNRVEDTVTVTAYTGTAGNSTLQDTLSIDVADSNALPAVVVMVVDEDGEVLAPQPTSVTEGSAVKIAVMPVDDKGKVIEATETLMVELMASGSADSRDYRLAKQTLEITSGEMSSDPVDLMAEMDEDVGMESLMFDAVVSGEKDNGTETSASAGVLSLYIEDGTTKNIEPKATEADYDALKAAIAAAAGEEGLNPGETVSIMTSDLFDVGPGYTASYGVSVDGESVSASASGEMVTINAEMAGESEITVTGTARMASSSLEPSQTVSNVAELKFPVMVVDTTLAVMLSADPMEIAEGGTSMITATANREITAGDGDVEIGLTVVGDGELDADSIMLAMGDMSGSAMLTSTEDEDFEENETLTVVAAGSGIAGTMQVAVAVTDNDVAPEPENTIAPKSEEDAYPVITAAIAAGAGEDEMLTPGESFEIMASDLFMVMEGYAATYRVSVDGTAVSGSVAGDSISVMAGSAGEAKVTITGTAKMAASSFEPSQDATNVASITFAVMVVEPGTEPVPALPLIAQLLLALGLMGGGARLYRRRQG